VNQTVLSLEFTPTTMLANVSESTIMYKSVTFVIDRCVLQGPATKPTIVYVASTAVDEKTICFSNPCSDKIMVVNYSMLVDRLPLVL